MSDYDDELCRRFISYNTSKIEIRSSVFRQLRIIFNFSLNLKTSIWIINQDFTIGPSPGEVPSSENFNYFVAETLPVSSSYDDVRDAIAKAVATTVGDHLRHEERRHLIERTLADVRRKFRAETPPKYRTLCLDIDIAVENAHITDSESDDDDDDGMAPAAESPFRLLEKYEVDCSRVGDSRCCICLEEFGGGALIKTPCSHVFHGGCIEEWLKCSHNCPLCRYVMPAK